MSDEIVVVEVDDDLFPDTPQPVHADRPVTVARPTGPSWSTIALLCVACIWIGSNLDGCKRDGGDDRDDSIVIDEAGCFVLVLEDTSEAGQERLTDGQAAAIASTEIMTWCESNEFEFRKLDPNAVDESKIEPIWNTLIAKAKKPPSLTASVDGRFHTIEMPNGIDEAIQKLEAIK